MISFKPEFANRIKMSRLDKQLDQLSGEKLVKVEWPDDETVDVPQLRANLIREIDSHSHRVPLDLRAVKGAPPDLVELLVDMRRYARSKSKNPLHDLDTASASRCD